MSVLWAVISQGWPPYPSFHNQTGFMLPYTRTVACLFPSNCIGGLLEGSHSAPIKSTFVTEPDCSCGEVSMRFAEQSSVEKWII